VLRPETLLARTARMVPVPPLSRADREHRHCSSQGKDQIHDHPERTVPSASPPAFPWPRG